MQVNRKLSYRMTLTGYFSLMALLLLWPTILAPPERIPVALILILCVVPLLLPLRGILHGRRNAYIWAGYLSLFYFAHAITESGAIDQPRDFLIIGTELLASSLLYFGVACFLKTEK